MNIDQQIKQTEWEIKHWGEELVNRRRRVRRAEARVKEAQFTVKVWEDHLRILQDEAGK